MPEELLTELRTDIKKCTSRVLREDSVMNLVRQYQNILLKYGNEHEEEIDKLVYQRLTELL